MKVLTGLESLIFEYQHNGNWVQTAPKGTCPSALRVQYVDVTGYASESCVYEVGMPRLTAVPGTKDP